MNVHKAMLTIIIAVIAAMAPVSISAAITVGGIITGDTSWTAADTIMVTDTLTVTATGHLTIEAGAVIMVDSDVEIYVFGELTAEGSADNHIVITSFADVPGGFPAAGQWTGITFLMDSKGLMRYCELRYGQNPITIARAAVEFYHCTVENFLLYGFYIDGKLINPPVPIVISNCIFRQTDSNLLGTAQAISIYYAVAVTVTGCEITDCMYGLYFYGSQGFNPQFAVSECEISRHQTAAIFTGG